MKLHAALFLLFFNLLVLSSWRMTESGFKASIWWALVIGVIFFFALRRRLRI
jgi:hypothetical protein